VRTSQPDSSLFREELKTNAILRLLDDAAEMGCLFLLLTGGEPLLRDDFAEIYRHAKRIGMLVTVFSNGTLMKEPILDLFSELPPRCVEITLYGATDAVHDKITDMPGSLRRCREGIDALQDRGVGVRLKTILMNGNRHELDDMRKLAADYGLKFRFDACIFPRLNGDRHPVSLRIPASEAVDREFEDVEREQEWVQLFDRRGGITRSTALYRCGAGTTAFHVDPYGHLQPCLMVRNVKVDLRERSFDEGWREIELAMGARKVNDTSRCRTCEKSILCGYCPGFFELETGTEIGHSDYLCAIGHRRLERLQARILGGNEDGEKRKREAMQAAV
jgi:radical SAM protein with 4Fe4S-binding SPASM domain